MRTLTSIHYMLVAFICSIAYSCQQLPEDNDILSDDTAKSLEIKVRSTGEAEIIYPLYLYAFSENGKLAASQTIADAEGSMSLPLSKGDFQIVAISGASDAYQFPESPTMDDAITLAGNKGAKTALMTGRANVEIGDASTATAQITLTHAVAELNVLLKDIPDNVTSVQLALSPLHSALSMSGEYGGDSQKVKVDCNAVTEGVWAAEATYIFPGSGLETVFSIYFKTDDGKEVTYGYTYKGVPKANHLFNVTGTYAGGIIVNGDFEIGDWEGSINVDFEFGTNIQPDEEEENDKEDEDEGQEDTPVIDSTEIPEVGTIWNDMIVVDIADTDEQGANLLLMSLDEWEIITAQANDVINGYSVNGISDWRLPTHDEAAVLRARFNGNRLSELNEAIAEYDSQLYGLAYGEEERYLCLKNGLYYSFQFIAGTRTTKAGEKRSYYVRLVKTYRLNLE